MAVGPAPLNRNGWRAFECGHIRQIIEGGSAWHRPGCTKASAAPADVR